MATFIFENLSLFVLKTRKTPLKFFYAAFYTFICRGVTLLVWMGSFSYLKTVYLRRSLAMQCGIYGLSDIDLCFLFEDSISDLYLKRLRNFYSLLCKFCPLLDKSPEMYRLSHFRKRFETEPRFYYRVLEGHTTWKTLYGKNHLDTFHPIFSFEAVANFCELQGYFALLNLIYFSAEEKTRFQKIRLEYFLLKLICAFFRPLAVEYLNLTEMKRPFVLEALLKEDVTKLPTSFVSSFHVIRQFISRALEFEFSVSIQEKDPATYQALMENLLIFMSGVVQNFADKHGQVYFEKFGNPQSHPLNAELLSHPPQDLEKLRCLVQTNSKEGRETVLETKEAYFNFSLTSLRFSQLSLVLKFTPKVV